MKISNLFVCFTAIVLLASTGCGGPEKAKDRVSREKREKIEMEDESALPTKEVKMQDLSTVDP